VWSPDSSRIVTSATRTARVWEAATGKLLASLKGHTGSTVYATAWNSNGTRIITASDDTTARIWDAATGKEVGHLDGHSGRVNSAEWRPGRADVSSAVVTASADGTARLWSVSPSTDRLVQSMKEQALRCLTQAQRNAYFLPKAPPSWCVEHRLWPYHSDAWQDWLPKRKVWLATGRQGPEPELPKE
jgi:WD40 repeat protein